MAIGVVSGPTILLNEGSMGATATMPILTSGSNGRVELSVHCYTGSGNCSTPTSVMCNSVSATFIAGDTPGSAVSRAASSTYFFKDSDFAAISGQTISTSGHSGTVKDIDVTILTGASQNPPANVNQGRASSGTITLPLTRASNSITIARSFTRAASTVLTLSNPTRDGFIAYTNRRVTYANFADTAGSPSFTSTTSLDTTAHVYNIEEAASKTIVSVNGDNTINSGEVNSAVVSGYVEGVNPITGGTVGSLDLVSVSQSGTTVTFTPPAPTNAAYWPEPDTAKLLTLTDGTTPATFSALFRSLSGLTSIVLSSPDNSTPYKLGYWATTEPVTNDRIMYDPTFWTLTADTSYSGAEPNASTVWYHWVAATGFIYIYNATISNSGEIVSNNGLTSSGLANTPLRMTGLTMGQL